MSKNFKQMIQHDAAGGIILVCAALLALIFANSPLDGFYNGMLNLPVAVKFGSFEIAKPLLLWINDGLMAIFFFMVGLEIKREILQGHLNSVAQITLPAIAAVAGIAVPALIYVWFNQDDAVAVTGWAIPSATDIAFALGVFSLFGRSLPITLKLFLLSVAIFDDIGAIVIIALFYSADLSTTSLVVAAVGLLVLFGLNRYKIRAQGAYILVGMIVWAAVLKSGVHATLAGFAVAMFIPINVKNEDGHPMLHHMEHSLHNWVAFFILPVFAFANAGVQLIGTSADDIFNPVVMGIVAGLFIGKQVGIFGACWIAVKAGVAKLPEGTNWTQLYGVTLLCGIGFTMSLFIGSLAFEHQGFEHLNSVKVGVLSGSILSAIAGAFFISRSRKAAESAVK
ncbi:Na+/H+ antiporter NhaA [Psychrosphaera sp. F3M07]|uniref:Na+/H+ antiporter NhaA n=1 Tax=Psychrosphaera sp. F3M07 TaxID=2841560 RepID=UPI001C094515|nr:Na+/H+ antiporter NhaA [Psychrosphaera sp. F3M07]MBU2918139.1 Na+/H+ antiporter NhaA [Psychrosphaera sp. F3M07]